LEYSTVYRHVSILSCKTGLVPSQVHFWVPGFMTVNELMYDHYLSFQIIPILGKQQWYFHILNLWFWTNTCVV